jgi:undecaprenyl-diphosphatase
VNQLIVIVAQYIIFLLPLLIGIILLKLPSDRQSSLLITLAAGGILSLVGITIASHFFYDPRPFVSGDITPLFLHAADNGFPSDHTTLAALLAFIGYAYSKKIGLVMTFIALAIGVARVLAHVHSWIDIFGGVIIAAISAILAINITYYIIHKLQPRSYVRTAK